MNLVGAAAAAALKKYRLYYIKNEDNQNRLKYVQGNCVDRYS